MNQPNEFLKEMGKRIAAARKALGLTQEQAAEKADVSVGVLSTAERGVKALRPENIAKISRALNVSCDYLLTGAVSQAEAAGLADKLAQLGEKEKRALCAVLSAALETLQ